MEVIVDAHLLNEPTTGATDCMSVIEAEQSFPATIVQRERISDPVRPMAARLDSPNLELDEVAVEIQ